MATIDYSIAQSFKPIQLESPVNQMVNLYQLQGAQQANQLRGMQMAATQREQDAQNALASAFKSSMTSEGDIDYESLKRKLAESGQGAQIPSLVKAQREAQKAGFESEKAQTDLVDSRLKTSQALLQQVRTPEQYIAWHEANHSDPILGPALAKRGITAESARANIDAAMRTPGGFEKLLQQSQIGIEKFATLNKSEPTPASVREYQAFQDMSPAEKREFMRLKRQEQQPATPAAPVAVIDPVTGKPTYVSREEAIGGKMTPASAQESIPPKEIQKREAAYPQATSAVKGFEAKSESFVKDLQALRDHPGLPEITGVIAGRAPGITKNGRAAQALYDKILAKGGFEALQQMREASKTGGALGNVSNQEGKQLQASFAAIDRRQDAADVRAALDMAISDVEGARVRMREAYDDTYSYKSAGKPAASLKGNLSPMDKQALDWANSNPKDPRAAKIKQRLGM